MTVAQIEQVAPLLFLAFAGLTVISAWAIVLSQNIVRMAVYLLLTLGGVAGLYLMMQAQFLAAIQLVVYAGGTLILIVFGVMLTSKSPFLQLKVGRQERLAAGALAVLFAALLIFAITQTPTPAGTRTGGATTAAENTPATPPTVTDIGRALLTDFMVPFEVAAVLLLVVMIAAAYMARRRAEAPKDEGPGG